MRNDASNLNLHLLNHHLTDSSACPHCNDPYESPSHYFIHCPHYNIHRECLKNTFQELNIDFTIQNILFGSDSCDDMTNVELFNSVHEFIKQSKRFS